MSETPYLYCCHKPADELAATVEAFRDRLQYLYFESESAIELLPYRSPDASWSHGRAFGAELEVRWDRAKDGFDLLLLTEKPWPSLPGWEPLPGSGHVPIPDSAAPGQILLWGTHISALEHPHRLAGDTGNASIETRIPRPLAYPLSATSRRVRARVMVYRCRERPILTRLVAVEGDDDEPAVLW